MADTNSTGAPAPTQPLTFEEARDLLERLPPEQFYQIEALIEREPGGPARPQHPFVELGSAEGTTESIDVVLAYMHQSLFAEIENPGGSSRVSSDHLSGQLRLLEGLRSAVAYLGQMAMPGNVTKLEGRS